MSRVIVNGVTHDWQPGSISYKSVCELAGVSGEPTVTYRYDRSCIGGTITANDSDNVYLDPEGGVVFNVTHVGRA